MKSVSYRFLNALEISKWLEAGEESIFSLETEKNLPGASYELPEAAARTENSQKSNFGDGL
jgi:hypothetical protein